jgi:hypothetical protein
MQVGIFLPTSHPNPSPQAILDSARVADQGGLDSVWVIDRVMFPLYNARGSLVRNITRYARNFRAPWAHTRSGIARGTDLVN